MDRNGDDLFMELKEALLERTLDKDAQVRLLAVSSLCVILSVFFFL